MGGRIPNYLENAAPDGPVPSSAVGFDVSNREIKEDSAQAGIFVALAKFLGPFWGTCGKVIFGGRIPNYLEIAAPDRPVPSSAVGFDMSDRDI